ncbi:hypothetical protein THAOC_37533 [Thalassiosira oceanica]|uniref:Uncharacterized protein n=1 Tax=Thalassiosira oceanica TaxID=159749 RepID=K0QYB1_THAOC|nr:hypothetical protein THAOC_37533 [Thalassiosira oceanica]|eukprot:EJK43973.1 hypothetical protein THAOC_37533 [Thalassiosira oceanica]
MGCGYGPSHPYLGGTARTQGMLQYLVKVGLALTGMSYTESGAGDRRAEALNFPSWATTVHTMPTSRPKLLREQDDMEEFHLRRREADGPNPRIPAVGAMVFGSFVHHRAAEI